MCVYVDGIMRVCKRKVVFGCVCWWCVTHVHVVCVSLCVCAFVCVCGCVYLCVCI